MRRWLAAPALAPLTTLTACGGPDWRLGDDPAALAALRMGMAAYMRGHL
jgi:hypothetical protein